MDNFDDFIDGLAEESVNKQLARHPEYLPEKEKLLKSKKEELRHRVEERHSKTYEELQRAGKILARYIEELPKEERERITKQIVKINQKISGDDQILQKSFSGDFSLQKLLDIDEGLIQEIYALALSLQDDNQPLDAQSLLKLLIVLNPYVPDFWIGLGFSCLHVHELDDAQNYFDTAISMDTLNPRPYYFASLCAKLRKETQKAINYCEVGIGLGSAEWDEAFNQLKESLGA